MTTEHPNQPDGIADGSHDLPDPQRAAERVREFLEWYGDGRLYPCVAPGTEAKMPPLYARDLEALRQAAAEIERLRVESQKTREALQTPEGYATKMHALKVRQERDQARAALAEARQPQPDRGEQRQWPDVDPRYLRHCDWPGCFRAYNILTGPQREIDGHPWKQRTGGVRVILCPDHSQAGHLPGEFSWEPGQTTIGMSCECGETISGLTPTSTERCLTWWQAHLAAGLLAARRAQPDSEIR